MSQAKRHETIFHHLSFASRVSGTLLLALAALVGVLVTWTVSLSDRAMTERRTKIRNLIEVASAEVEHFGGLEKAGTMTRAEAQRAALAFLRQVRFEEHEYFWVNDADARMVMHPMKPELDGKDMSAFKDPTGKAIFVEFARTARASSGGGYVEYLWPKPGEERPVRKLSFLKLYAPWGWVVGAGIYLDDVDRALTAQKRLALAVAGLAAAALLGAGWLASRSLKRAIGGLRGEAGALTAAVARGELSARADTGAVHFEFRPVIEGMNEVMDAFAAPIGLTADYLARISAGDLPPAIEAHYQGDFDGIKEALNRCIATLRALESDAGRLVDATVHGKLGERPDAARHGGAFRRIVEGMNRLADTLVGHLDAVPAPAFIIDRSFRFQYLNRAALAVLGKGAAELLGNRCSEQLKSGDCGTDQCACLRAMRDGRVATSETSVRTGQGVLEIAYSGVPVRDAAGEVIGAMELMSDQTAARCAARASGKIVAFQELHAQRVLEALGRLSHGDLQAAAVETDDGDADTAAARVHFQAIAGGLSGSIEAVRRLVVDFDGLAQEAVAGRLSTRADPTRHPGDFGKIVLGVNRTLDAVIAPVNEAAGVLERLSARDLRARVEGSYQGDHARIKGSVNATGEALERALTQVSGAVEQVHAAAAQIAASSQAVAAGASEQAAALQETGSSVESLAGLTRQSADNAQSASALAQAARSAATEGAESVARMQAAMGRIKASAQGTSVIIRDINDIAFQTNLLALNAAVEAARAGEAGRGFAVVAEEVRSLALRAKEAAHKTEELIRQSVRETGQGEASAGQVSGKLGEIVEGVGKVTAIVSEMAAAARAQASGIEQVTRSLAESDKVTQQNAASAEQSSSAASELSGQAEALAALVCTFQLGERSGPARADRNRGPRPPAGEPSEMLARLGGGPGPRGDDALR